MKKILSFCILLTVLFFSACQALPDGFLSALTTGTWRSTETISTPNGLGDIIRTQTFSPDGNYTLVVDHPTTGTTTTNALYTVGYYEPKHAFVLHPTTNPQAVLDLPIFFELRDNLQTLITSTNANLALPRRWTR